MEMAAPWPFPSISTGRERELSIPDTYAGGVTISEASDNHLLRVTCSDRDGLLSDLVQHIHSHGIDLVSADVATDTESGLIVDSFVVRDAESGSKVASEKLAALSSSLWQVALGGAPRIARRVHVPER